MGQGVRLVTGEALTSSSMDRPSFESPSPWDPSLIVIGSPSTPDLGGSSTRFGDDGVGPPPMDEVGRSRRQSTTEERRSLQALKSKKVSHDDQHKGNTISGMNR